MPPVNPEDLASLWAMARELGPWLTAMVVLIFYRKPILAALQRSTRDPLVDALTEQNRHFADNNKLFLALGPALEKLIHHTATSATCAEAQSVTLADLLAVQRGIKEELIRGGSRP